MSRGISVTLNFTILTVNKTTQIDLYNSIHKAVSKCVVQILNGENRKFDIKIKINSKFTDVGSAIYRIEKRLKDEFGAKIL